MTDLTSLSWAPTASLAALRFRAQCIAIVRRFFAERELLEVDTPVLCQGATTDPHIALMSVEATMRTGKQTRWLQTSPEACMKRLLAAGSGPIYQLAHAFRDGEIGQRHNPEFMLLEWYQPDYSLTLLMNETIELIEALLQRPIVLRVNRYRQLFLDHLQLDPITAPLEQLRDAAIRHGGEAVNQWSRDTVLDLLMSHEIEPHLGGSAAMAATVTPVVIDAVIDYPASQAALARHHHDPIDDALLASRFELYWQGVELANGYDELTSADEQLSRFTADNQQRRAMGLPEATLDHALIEALDHGLPSCAGVALGLDRLIMLAYGASRLEDVVAFPATRA